MDTSRNSLSNIICIIFSLMLAFVFCFSIGLRFGIDNMVSRAIIAAVHCGFIVGLAFVLHKIILKLQNKKFYVDYDKVFIISISVISVIFVLVRLLVIAGIIKSEFITSSVYEIAKGQNGTLFIGFNDVNQILATILSLVFKVAGDTFFSVYLVQFIITAISYALIVSATAKLIDKFSAVIIAGVLAIVPIFYNAISSDSSDTLVVLMFAILFGLTAKYKDIIEKDEIKTWFSLLIAIFCGIFSIFSVMLTFYIVIPLVLLNDCRNENRSDRIINSLIIVIGSIFTAAICLLIDCNLFSKTGIEGFAYSIIDFVKVRFSYKANFSFLNSFIKNDIFFIVLILCVIYCVMFWKHEEDAAHLAAIEVVLILSQIIGLNVNNHNAFIMATFLLLAMVASAGIKGLGYTADLIRVYKIDDSKKEKELKTSDTNDAVKQLVTDINANDKEEVKGDINENLVTGIDDTNMNEVIDITETNDITGTNVVADTNDITEVSDIAKSSEIPEAIDTVEVPDIVEVPEITETIDAVEGSDITEAIDVVKVSDNNEAEMNSDNNVVSYDDADISIDNKDNTAVENEERKYKEAETRQSSDYGINNADFESLFTGGYVPPKFVYKDIYTEDIPDNVENLEASDDDPEIEETDLISNTTLEQISNDSVVDVVSPESEENDSSIEDNNDMDDKNAYVNSFFGYLYNDSSDKSPETTVDSLENDKTNIETCEDSLFLDEEFNIDSIINNDDITIGDSFFNEEPVIDETQSDVVTEEFGFFDEDDSVAEDSDNTISENILIKNSDPSEDESIEEILQKKIDEDFSYEDAFNKKLDLEEYNDTVGFSFEDAIEKKLAVEESIEKAIEHTNESLEEVINEKLIAEESMEEAIENDYVSYEKTVSKKIDIEEKIDDKLNYNDFSYQEAIETKIDVEKAIENATNDKLLEEFGPDELFDNVEIDFSGANIPESSSVSQTNKTDGYIEYDKINIQYDNVDTLADYYVEKDILAVENELDGHILDDNTDSSEDVTPKEEIKFIENPLPVPKKPKHREMDYGRVIPYAWMHYDVELDNKNNHYDV